MNQSQASLSTQLEALKIVAEFHEFDLTNIGSLDAHLIYLLANFHGLYDAADYVQRQYETGRRISL